MLIMSLASCRGSFLLLFLAGVFSTALQAEVDYAARRQAMVDEIRRETRWTSDELGRRELDAATLASKRCPGLHLAGEIVDVDGRLGGFNFQ